MPCGHRLLGRPLCACPPTHSSSLPYLVLAHTKTSLPSRTPLPSHPLSVTSPSKTVNDGAHGAVLTVLAGCLPPPRIPPAGQARQSFSAETRPPIPENECQKLDVPARETIAKARKHLHISFLVLFSSTGNVQRGGPEVGGARELQQEAFIL
eukprot:1312322-Rhodomonas_salina.2